MFCALLTILQQIQLQYKHSSLQDIKYFCVTEIGHNISGIAIHIRAGVSGPYQQDAPLHPRKYEKTLDCNTNLYCCRFPLNPPVPSLLSSNVPVLIPNPMYSVLCILITFASPRSDGGDPAFFRFGLGIALPRSSLFLSVSH